MNSRPLSALSNEPEDLTALIPGHFLVGRNITSPPEPVCLDADVITVGSRWKVLLSMRDQFWKRWIQDTLRTMQQRSKWLHPQKSLEVGDLVVIQEDNIPPGMWLMGRIIKEHPGQDGLVRVVTVKTADSYFRRAIGRLIPLPVESPTIAADEKEDHQ